MSLQHVGGGIFQRKYRLKAFCKAKPLPHLRQTVPTVRRTNTISRTVSAPFSVPPCRIWHVCLISFRLLKNQ